MEAAGRPSGYQMNYSIRDIVPSSSTSPGGADGHPAGHGTDMGLRAIPAD